MEDNNVDDKLKKSCFWTILNWTLAIVSFIVVVLMFLRLFNEQFTNPSWNMLTYYDKNDILNAPGRWFFKRPLTLAPIWYPSINYSYATCNVLEKLNSGLYRLPTSKMDSILRMRSQLSTFKSNSWTISFWAAFELDKIKDLGVDRVLMVRKGYGMQTCPQIVYNVRTNSLEFGVNTEFNGYRTYSIKLDNIAGDLSKYNNYTWVQDGLNMKIYVNGVLVNDTKLDNGPYIVLVSRGPLWIVSDGYVKYRKVHVAGDAWSTEGLNNLITMQYTDSKLW